VTINSKLKKDQLRSYLNKDFDSFRADLLLYAKTFFPDQIQDFSEASLGGLLLDMTAYVGDVMSYYLDHQFNELNIETATESGNIEKILKSSGVPVMGASPASANVDFYVRVDADTTDTTLPVHNYLPKIDEGTTLIASNGVTFTLTETLDFSKKDDDGNYMFQQITPSSSTFANTFILKMTGQCVSGKTRTENIPIPNQFVPFRRVTISNPGVTEIISVRDSEGNEYYEVGSLVQNTVYKRVSNVSLDYDEVPENLEVMPAPFRFVVENSIVNNTTKLLFGSGQADSLDDDIIPDPSELSLPLYGKKTLSRFSIDPNNLIKTKSLGISPINTTISIKYRYGGGLSHNAPPGSINGISTLLTTFNSAVPKSKISSIRASIDVINPESARGGENAPSLEDLKRLVVSARNSQSRIVTKDDLLSHIYMMPSRFGRVFRAGVRSNPENPLSTRLYIVSRTRKGLLSTSPDSLKDNLALFLNQNRLISDAIDILDSPIVNIGVKYSIVTDATSNKSTVVQIINSKIKTYFNVLNFQIDQPIFLTEIQNIIINTDGVISLSELELINLSGTSSGRVYSDVIYSIGSATLKGIVSPPHGGIFELKFPNDDIIGVGE